MIEFIIITILTTTIHLEFYPIFVGQIYYGSLVYHVPHCLNVVLDSFPREGQLPSLLFWPLTLHG